MPAVIVENDTSKWNDQTGVMYHFPKRYAKILTQGTQIIYYKGRIKNKQFILQRLSSEPHYFGNGRIGEVFNDPKSKKGDLFAHIEGFAPFNSAVLAKVNGQYLETIPAAKKSNYWRNGVRFINHEDYAAILQLAVIMPEISRDSDEVEAMAELESYAEGSKYKYYGTKYERDRALRREAIKIHGLTCKACDFDFEVAYGEYAQGYIHVHHLMPISKYGGERNVDPLTDMVTLCANCHAVVHRQRHATLSMSELIKMIKVRWVLR